MRRRECGEQEPGRSLEPVSVQAEGLDAEGMKQGHKNGYATVLTSSKLQRGKDPPLKPRTS